MTAKTRPQPGSSAPAASYQNVTFSAPQLKGSVMYGIEPGSNKVFTVQADQVGPVLKAGCEQGLSVQVHLCCSKPWHGMHRDMACRDALATPKCLWLLMGRYRLVTL